MTPSPLARVGLALFSFFVATLATAACGDGPDGEAATTLDRTPARAELPAAPTEGTAVPAERATETCRADMRERFACSADGRSRERCAASVPITEPCARGCLRADAKDISADDVCLGTSSTWSCTGSYGTKKATDGDYYLTAFGCWTDAQGNVHGDGQDNCVPSCFAKAKAAGLCPPGDTGKQCEERTTWFTADAARFGCLARVRVTNPANGKSVVAVALDYGPACSVEAKAKKAVLDASGRVNRELFGTDHGVTDRALVHVVEVDGATPLGPVP